MLLKRLMIAFAFALTPGVNAGETANIVDEFADAGDAGELESDLNLLTKVTRDNGNVVEFYEPSPGFIMISELGKVPNKPLGEEVKGMKAVDLFQHLAPTQSVPPALQAAQQRAESATQGNPDKGTNDKQSTDMSSGQIVASEETPDKEGSEKVTVDDSACPKSWWEDAISCSVDADWDVEWYYRTGTSWFLRNDTDRVWVGACSYRGAVTLKFQYRPWYDWHTQGTWTVNAGYYRQAWRSNASVDFDIKSTVYDASGDGYHHCGWGFR